MDGDQRGAAQRGLVERVRQDSVGVARIADTDDDLTVNGARLLPDHDDRAARLHGRVPADRAEQHGGEPSRAAGAHDEHERPRAALGDRHRRRAVDHVDVDELSGRDFSGPGDGVGEHAE